MAPFELKQLAGRMWWSFYESDATFENFVIRALAYVTKRPREEMQKLPVNEREEGLLAALNREPYLLVLDGLERILSAYANLEAARSDEDITSAKVRARKAVDPHVGAFLRKLSACRSSRVLISARLHPADLEDKYTHDPLAGCRKIELSGLADDDALLLWRAFGVDGTRGHLLPLFDSFGRHPLVIQALAGEIKRDRRAIGDYQRWLKDHPRFDPMALTDVKEACGHVLAFALSGLTDFERQALHTLAAFRMPVPYDTLTAVLGGDDRTLDRAFAELEDRGLLGWDRRSNRYDLHPIVRSVVWNGLNQDARQLILAGMQTHFEPIPAVEWYKVKSQDDLAPAIELYRTLIGLQRYDDAIAVFDERLNFATQYRLSASRLRVELLEALFPDGIDKSPRLTAHADQVYALDGLAQSFQFAGKPGRAMPLFLRASELAAADGLTQNLSQACGNLSQACRFTGNLRASEAAARQGLKLSREQGDRFQEAITLRFLGTTLAARGVAATSNRALEAALAIAMEQSNAQQQGTVIVDLGQRALWIGAPDAARSFADKAWELAHGLNLERNFIRAARLQGQAALALGDIGVADERLRHALTRARAIDLVEEELPALIALAGIGDRDLFDQVWEPAERGPYPLFHADALNVLAQIERDAGNTEVAVKAAQEAYKKAWCDGPPFAYHWGLENAKALLAELGAPEPNVPPFDEGKFESMPDIEI